MKKVTTTRLDAFEALLIEAAMPKPGDDALTAARKVFRRDLRLVMTKYLRHSVERGLPLIDALDDAILMPLQEASGLLAAICGDRIGDAVLQGMADAVEKAMREDEP